LAVNYTSNLKLAKPTPVDPSRVLQAWNGNADAMDQMAPLAGLAVTSSELPSTSLNVSVAAGQFLRSDGSPVSYTGIASQAIPARSTRVLYLDETGALQIATAYPVGVAYTPLATVVTGNSTVTTITDNRVRGGRVLYSLGNYASDSAAATGGVPIGGLYRNGSAVMVRVT
jgi:hypothetical protein